MNFPARLKKLLHNKVFLSSFFILLVVTTIFSTKIFAQASPASTNVAQQQTSLPLDQNTESNVPRNQHTSVQTIVIDLVAAFSCQLSGIDSVNPQQGCIGVDPQTKKFGFVQNGGGAIGGMGHMIGMLYTPQAHMSDYFHHLASKFILATPAYAAGVACNPNNGIGYCGLLPLIGIWTTFRNLAYLIFVFIFILIGLAIMLRVKIDPRTVMTVQNQIPKIIIALVLITFSYAIAGFLIDIMYLLIYVIFNIFSTPGLVQNPGDMITKINATQQTFNGDSAIGVFNNLIGFTDVVGGAASAVKDAASNLFSAVPPPNQSSTQFCIWFVCTTPIVNAIGGILGYVFGAIAFLVVAIAVFLAMFRLWFQLIAAYVFILLDVVLAPFMILIGIFPGGPISFSGWLRDLGANLVAFPVVITMFLLAKTFMVAFGQTQTSGQFVAPLVGNPGSPNDIGALIGLGIILIAPEAVTMMKELLKAPQFKYTAAAGQSLARGGTVLTGGGRATGSAIAPPVTSQQNTGAWRFWRTLGGF